jgi:hypothetical protein
VTCVVTLSRPGGLRWSQDITDACECPLQSGVGKGRHSHPKAPRLRIIAIGIAVAFIKFYREYPTCSRY